jgi:ankyrin repeat protein
MKLLLENKADPNLKNHFGFSPFLESLKVHSNECIEILLRFGASFEDTSSPLETGGEDVKIPLETSGEDDDVVVSYGSTLSPQLG